MSKNKSLSFGSLLSALEYACHDQIIYDKKERGNVVKISEKKNQSSIYKLMEYVILGFNVVDKYASTSLASTASRAFNDDQKRLNSSFIETVDILKHPKKNETEKKMYCEFKNRINDALLINITERNKEILVCNLKKLMYAVPKHYESYFLKKDLNFGKNDIVKYGMNSAEISDFLANCILNSILLTVNNPEQSSKNLVIYKDAYNLENEDPYDRMTTLKRSTAIEFKIVGKGIIDLVLYNFESCCQHIVENNYKILSIENNIDGLIINVEKTKYTLRKIDVKNMKKEAEKVGNFVYKHIDEFHPKVSWRGRLLSDMVATGLFYGKWLGFAYYDNDEMIAYIDYKMRLDNRVEIGVILVETEYRDQSLATSLIYLIELMFVSQELYAGTYEGNDAMERTFLKTGFMPALGFDTNSFTLTNKLADRVVKDNPNKFDNSLYFITTSLLESLLTYRENKMNALLKNEA